MSFTDVFRSNSNLTETENGARAYSTTGNPVLNLFARVGGLRNASETEIKNLYLEARNYDKELADNIILYSRNIRDGGIGERRVARIMLKTLALKDPAKIRRNFDTITSTGRWDDLWIALEGTTLEQEAIDYVSEQFVKDINDMAEKKPITLLAKWLPSSNASSAQTRARAKKFYKAFGINEKKYRKTLSAMRAYLDVVEKKMSKNQWSAIDYEAVPSVAATRYRNAFRENDSYRYNQYIESVNQGKAKINASVSYPYELIRPYIVERWNRKVDGTLEAQWKNLPNYVSEGKNAIVIADVSGSMSCDNYRPMATSVSLGIYFAEHNVGPYANLFMTFTNQPRLYELNPKTTVFSRVNEVMSQVGYNTDLDKAFAEIYKMAVEADEAPDALIVISDGEIDSYKYRNNDDIVTKWARKYEAVGLKVPKLILWNVESRGNRFLAKSNNPNVAFISGSSASTFKELSALIENDPIGAMNEILSRPAFQWK